MTDSLHAFDANSANFQQDVLEASFDTPVVIDFWAPWCAPCRSLKPVLEKLAEEYAGRFRLAKVNTDEESEVAGLFGIRSLPTVVMMRDGQPVDGFMGAQPEGAVRGFLDKHLPEAAEAAPEAEPEPDNPDLRLAELRAQVAAEPDKDELQLDLAEALTAAGEIDEAAGLLQRLPAKWAQDDRVRRSQGRIDFARSAAGAPPLPELEARISHDPDDHEARHLIATRLFLAGHTEAALDQLLELLRRDRDWSDGLPRKRLIAAFALIDDAALVSSYRKKMASVLF